MKAFMILALVFFSWMPMKPFAQSLFQTAPGTPMVCSFNCSTTFIDLQKNCPAPLQSLAKPMIATRVNPFVEFDGIISRLKGDQANTFTLSYSFLACTATCNAASTLDRYSNQIIYYNPDFLDKIKGSDEKVKWAVRCIIAHEIGHHILGHTLPGNPSPNNEDRRKREKRADFFTGFVISRFPGATIENALEGIRSLDASTYSPRNDQQEANSTYPTLANRMDAVREGFLASTSLPIHQNTNRSTGTALTLKMFRDIDSIALAQMQTLGRSQIFRTMDKLFTLGMYNEARLLAEDKLKNLNLIGREQLWQYKSMAQELGNDKGEAIKSQRKAVKLGKDDPATILRLQHLLREGTDIQKIEADKLKEKLESEKIRQKMLLRQ
ncbi:hypothetical protein ACFE6N_06725 [Pedobacter sp. BG31]|uniref:hypothetical protein n=1 Tax=Pedobacter sp. BG31 TaxID=3349697 RepID=UPI0035F47047